jgi:hypothetical protein
VIGLQSPNQLPDVVREEFEQLAASLQSQVLSPYGVWLSAPSTAGYYSGSGSMTWVPATKTHPILWRRVGQLVTFNVWANFTTVAGTPSTTLQLRLPAGMVPAIRSGGPISYGDNYGDGDIDCNGIGYWYVIPGYPFIYFRQQSNANWTASSGLTSIHGQPSFMVR